MNDVLSAVERIEIAEEISDSGKDESEKGCVEICWRAYRKRGEMVGILTYYHISNYGANFQAFALQHTCLLYTSPSPRDA